MRRLNAGWSTAGLASILLSALLAHAQEGKIVVGPKNVDLSAGADALMAGDAQEGVRLTLAGLEHASSQKERLSGLCNLCAGYIMLKRYDEALEQCNKALSNDDLYWRARTNRALIYVLEGRYDDAARDLDRVEKLAPQARTVKAVRHLLHDKLNPVVPSIVIDDRRSSDANVDDDGD